MNESEIVRGQLTTERIHAAQVANACVAVFGGQRDEPPGAPTAFRDTSVSYLVWVLSRFEQRDQLLAEFIERRRSAAERASDDTAPPEPGAFAAQDGTSRQALERLESALTAATPDSGRAAWQAFGQFFNTLWCTRREAIEQYLARLPRVAEWRAVCAVDADSIVEERTRYAQVAEHLPAGITLLGATDP